MSERDLDTGKLDVIEVKKIKEVENLDVADDYDDRSVEEVCVETRRMNKRQLQENLAEVEVKTIKQDEAAMENHVAEASTSPERFQAKKCNDSPFPNVLLECVDTDDDSVEYICTKDCRGNVIDLPDLQVKHYDKDEMEEDSDSSVDVGVEHPGINKQTFTDNDDDCVILHIDTDDMNFFNDVNEEHTSDVSQEIDPGDMTQKGQ